MAIIQGLPGVEVTVFTNGRTAREYDDLSELGKVQHCRRVVTKYIECKDDEPFTVRLKVTDEYPWGFKNHFLYFAALVDGTWVKGKICCKKDTEKEDWEQDIGYRISKSLEDLARYVYQEFAFSKIIKVDDATDEQHASDIDRMERLGTIQVNVYRVIPQEPGPVIVPVNNEHPRDFIVSREAARWKAPSHGIKFTRTQSVPRPSYVNYSPLHIDHGPFAIFRFKYRSREALREEGIGIHYRDTLSWFVEVSDKDEGDDERSNYKRNQRNLPGNRRGNRFREDVFRVGDNSEKERHRNPPNVPDDTNEVMLALRENTLGDLGYYNNILLSIEYNADKTIMNPEVTRQDTGEEIIPKDKNKRTTYKNARKRFAHRLGASDSAAQSTKALSDSKCEARAAIKTITAPLIDIENHHRALQQLQELRREFFRISEEVLKGLESSYRQSNFDAQAPTSTPTSTRVFIPPPLSTSNAPLDTVFSPSRSSSPLLITRNHAFTPNNAVPTVAPLTQTDTRPASNSIWKREVIAARGAGAAAVSSKKRGKRLKSKSFESLSNLFDSPSIDSSRKAKLRDKRIPLVDCEIDHRPLKRYKIRESREFEEFSDDEDSW